MSTAVNAYDFSIYPPISPHADQNAERLILHPEKITVLYTGCVEPTDSREDPSLLSVDRFSGDIQLAGDCECSLQGFTLDQQPQTDAWSTVLPPKSSA